MSGIETQGGACPTCLKTMEQKWESSHSGFMFDACPWCGFVYASNGMSNSPEEAEKVWNSILEHAKVSSREELIKKNHLVPYTEKENLEFFPSIFNHSDDANTLLLYKLLWNQYGSEEEDKAIEGKRVYWSQEIEQEGTIMDYKKGSIFILWDENKGSKLPYFEYSGTDLGDTILICDDK